ncbi:E3 ubiquitin-protein ligase TRAIP [Dendroctonus ponderosae]|uniref:E3 ubiquitin-protein ligase TRAIP n=1 Tax=Dendroctonus ponderosae TaxID=77166 RepID=UPI002034D651|nr:E3 ubiquitin-protein ligase TRAIP [Dendroctonus ponderosae]
MHITCVICSDLFAPSADIYSTQCGHIFHFTCLLQWMENSKTCPQCRNKVSSKNLIRLFVNVATSQGLEADVTLLQHKLDGVEFTMKLKDQEIKALAVKNQETMKQNKSLRHHTKELEHGEKRFESIIAAQKEQIKYFKDQVQNYDRLREENVRLKNEMKSLDQIQIALGGTRQQAEDIIRNENSIESLGLLASILKKSLLDSDSRKNLLQTELRKSKNELTRIKRQEADLRCEYESIKQQFESLKRNSEKEVAFLKDKFSQLASKATQGTVNESFNNSIRRLIKESPVNFHRTPVCNRSSQDFIDLDDCVTPPCSGASQSVIEINDSSHGDIADDSPLPASSMGMFGIQRAKMLGTDTSSKFSIFKSKQPSFSESTSSNKLKSNSVTYDGLGGSSKEDIFPTPMGVKRSRPLKITLSKLKKLSADAGRSRKPASVFTNFLDLS